jgi:hypothetical protein
VVLRPIGELKPYKRNARVHPRAQLEKLAASIREFGFLMPILVDRADRIIAGHARLEAARLLGLATVPTIGIDHLSDAQVRAFGSSTTGSPSSRVGTSAHSPLSFRIWPSSSSISASTSPGSSTLRSIS